MKATRAILKMKKAFSLFEMLVVMTMLGLCFVLFATPLLNLGAFYGKQNSQALINANSTLIIIEKILQRCLEFSPLNSGFECILKDSDNLILHRLNTAFIGHSGVLLKDENSNIYAPKSNFIYNTKEGLNFGVLANYNDLQGVKNNEFLFLYDLKDKKIHKARVLDREKLEFLNGEFTGFYALIEAKVSLNLENGELIYHHTPYLTGISHSGVLLDGLHSLKISASAGEFTVKLCLSKENCIQKWVWR
ncbi:type II secretion system protein [Campylobacter troglodytis]|uniref:type II secretion system protein n=1 Tax=Campylobacter troglodytis TaxID=654363 RepID=UPI00163CD579|nr:hypothetical protein [Campylobacter troglodytis]TQR60571.1 hypothetical protein DMC01_04935 [Campylobacter troglodytis]